MSVTRQTYGWGVEMWLPSEEEAAELFGIHFEALHRSSAAGKAEDEALALKNGGGNRGHRIWAKSSAEGQASAPIGTRGRETQADSM